MVTDPQAPADTRFSAPQGYTLFEPQKFPQGLCHLDDKQRGLTSGLAAQTRHPMAYRASLQVSACSLTVRPHYPLFNSILAPYRAAKNKNLGMGQSVDHANEFPSPAL